MALMEKYGVSTIPALVLLDGEGALICNCGQDHLQKDPTGKGFPWPAPISGPRLAQVGFAIPPLAEVLPTKPTGKPPPFPQPRRLTASLPVGRPVSLPAGRPVGHSDQTTEHAGLSERHPRTIQQSPTTATPTSSTRKREHSEAVRYDGQSRHRNRTSVSATPHLAFIQTPWQPWWGGRRNLLLLSLPVDSWNLCHWSLKVRSPHH